MTMWAANYGPAKARSLALSFGLCGFNAGGFWAQKT